MPVAQDPEVAYDEAFRDKVLRSFYRDGFVIAMPAQRKKRKVLLDIMIEDFVPGQAYSEQEVNFKILDHYDDYCTVRREMICEGLMERKNGKYVRVKTEE